MPTSTSQRTSWPVRFWHRKVRKPVIQELTRGTSVPKVTLACILGLVSATWPQIGTNPIMALILSWIFRCNKAITSGISLVFTPFQYVLMIPFLRVGEALLGLPHFKTTVPEIITIVVTDPIGSFAVLGLPLLHAILGWIVTWSVAAPVFYLPIRYLLTRQVKAKEPTT